jgi:hypothetical protein
MDVHSHGAGARQHVMRVIQTLDSVAEGHASSLAPGSADTTL